jgi:hypothetical protein
VIFLSTSTIPGEEPDSIDSEVHFIVWPSVTFDDSSVNSAFLRLNCCPPEPAGIPENETDCFQEKLGSKKTGGGVSFEIVPKSIFFQSGATQKTVSFKLRNKSDKQLQIIELKDRYAGNQNACTPGSSSWLDLPSFTYPLDGAVQISKTQLMEQNPPPYLGIGFYVQGAERSDVLFDSANLGDIRALYDLAPASYNLSLYNMESKDVQVNKQSGTSLKLCQFELKYRLGGDDPAIDPRILRAHLTISADQ